MSIFNCCTCPEPPDYDPGVDDPLDKYINTCGCPSVSVECESEGKTATLCGFSEFTGFVSSPPKNILYKMFPIVVLGIFMKRVEYVQAR
jgi:hypothetical protein